MGKIKKYGEFIINESFDQLIKMGGTPDLTKPSIFQYTLYRLPTEAELDEFEKYPELTADEIVNGFCYTIIGRGITSAKNIETIKDCMRMLIDKYPGDSRYPEALEIATRELKSKW